MIPKIILIFLYQVDLWSCFKVFFCSGSRDWLTLALWRYGITDFNMASQISSLFVGYAKCQSIVCHII